ncbi:MAG: phage major tail tube protein [Cyanobacteria bacterium P01_E01_bin.42]
MSITVIAIQPRITLNGTPVDGLLEELECPSYKFLTVESAGLGIVGTPELPVGRIGPVEMSLKLLGIPNIPVVKELLHNPFVPTRLTARAEQYTYTGGNAPLFGSYEAVFMLRPKEVELGTFETEESAKPEVTFACDRFNINIDDSEFINFDAFNSEGIRFGGKKIIFSAVS